MPLGKAGSHGSTRGNWNIRSAPVDEACVFYKPITGSNEEYAEKTLVGSEVLLQASPIKYKGGASCLWYRLQKLKNLIKERIENRDSQGLEILDRGIGMVPCTADEQVRSSQLSR